MYHQPLHLIRSVEGLLPSSPGASPSPGCLSLVSRLGCPGSTHGRGMAFLVCLLLFNRLGCPGSTHGRGMPFPDCLLLFNRLGCPGSTPGRGIPFPDCLLLFSPLHYTQSSGTVTHLSHTHTRQPSPYNIFDFLILEQILLIEGWVFFFFFFLGLKSIIYIALFFNFVGKKHQGCTLYLELLDDPCRLLPSMLFLQLICLLRNSTK